MRTVINGQDVYLDGDNIPEFSYSLNELTDFTKVKGSSSTTFDIPASNAARVGLGGVAMQEQPIGEVPIRIGEGGQVLFEGVCVPTEWTDESIKVVAYGDNATWFDRAKSTKCVEVDLGYTGSITTATIVSTWVAEQADLQAQLVSRSHFYPIIDYGSMFAFTASTDIAIGKVRWAVSVRALLRKFFTDAGFSVVIKGGLNSLWHRLMLPSSGHTYLALASRRVVSVSATQSAAPDFGAQGTPFGNYGFDTIDSSETPFTTYTSGLAPGYVFGSTIIATDGKLKVTVRATYRVIRPAGVVYPERQLVFDLQALTGGTPYPVVATTSVVIPGGTGNVDVVVDRELFVGDVQNGIPYTVTVRTSPELETLQVLGGGEMTFEHTPESTTDIQSGSSYWVTSAIAPSLTVADVISSLATMLRLVITTNQLSNEVTFQHYDDYLLDPSEGVDWRDRLSHNTLPAKVRPETPERFVFKYADDERDEYATSYNGETTWSAEGVYDTDGRDEEKVSTLKFAATQQGVRFNNAVVPVIKEVDKVTDYVKCKPRILVHGGFTTSAATVMTFAGAARTYCPRFYFAGSGGNDINIGFGNDAGRLGTLERFWRASLIRAVKPYLKGEFRVYDDEFMNFEFARPRLVNDGYGNVWMYVQVVKGKKFGDDDLVDCELIPV